MNCDELLDVIKNAYKDGYNAFGVRVLPSDVDVANIYVGADVRDSYDWDFESELLHRLNIAEIAYVEKDKIYAQLIHLHDFDKRMAFVQRLGNQNLKDTLFELIYSDKSRDV